jgi:TRAP-type mannitol/chloroaromatic compound transport system substrate-binding protein
MVKNFLQETRGKKTGCEFMKNKIALTFFIVMLMTSFIFISWAPQPSHAAQQVFRWRVQHFLPATHPAYAAFAKWCEDVKIASGGRLVIKASPIGTIVPAMEQWEAVSKGVLQMGFSYGAFWGGKTPVAGFSVGIPFTLRDVQDHYVLQRMGLEDLIRKAYAKHNIYYLRQNPCMGTVMSSKKPVTSVADIKGLKVRAVGVIGQMLAEAGAAVITVPGPEIYGALEKGIIDAAVYGPLASQFEMGFQEVTKYIVMPPLAIEADEMIINMDAWNALPDDLKKLLYLSAADHTIVIGDIYRIDSEKALNACLKKGLKVSQIGEEERAKLTQIGWKVVEKYAAKDPIYSEALNIMNDYLKLTGIKK